MSSPIDKAMLSRTQGGGIELHTYATGAVIVIKDRNGHVVAHAEISPAIMKALGQALLDKAAGKKISPLILPNKLGG